MTNSTDSASNSFSRGLAKVKALLAMAERDAGNEAEASVAAYLAGRKAYTLGLTTDDVWEHWGKDQASAAPWCGFIDGWYDQAEGKERA